MKKISSYFYQKSTWKIAVILTIVMVLYASLVLGKSSSCFQDQLEEGMKVFGLNFGYDLEYVSSFFNSLDHNGLICYRNFILIWDNIFPVVYGSMYIFWLSLIYKKHKKSKWTLINLFPVLPLLADWVENIIELNLVYQIMSLGKLSRDIVSVGSMVSQIKWILSTTNYLIIIIGVSLLIYSKLNKSKKQAI